MHEASKAGSAETKKDAGICVCLFVDYNRACNDGELILNEKRIQAVEGVYGGRNF